MVKVFNADARQQIAEVVRQVLAMPGHSGLGKASGLQGHVGLLVFVAKTGSGGIAARSGTTLGSGTVTLYTLFGGTIAEYADANSAAVTKTCYNVTTTAVAASTYIACTQEQLSGKLIVILQDTHVLVELCAQETATRNVPYDCLLGTWDPDEDGWCYDDAPTVTAIDHRIGPPLAEENWKGLYQPMPSTAHGTIYVCVSLDCEEPPEGCNTCA